MGLEKQRRAEKLQHEPSNELVVIGGVRQHADEIRDSILNKRQVEKANGRVVDRGVTVIASAEPVNIESHSFRESPGDFEQLKQDWEDRIVGAMEEPLVALVTRGGIGYGVQSDEAQRGSADVGVHSILTLIAQVLGQIYPRVQIAIIRPNDFTKRQQLDNLKTLADAVSALPAGTLTPEEVRALIPMTGISIPQVDEGEMARQATADESADEDVNVAEDGEEEEGERQDEMSVWADAMVMEAQGIYNTTVD